MKVSRISLAFKALRELGPRQLGFFALYRLGLTAGYFRWRTGDGRLKTGEFRHRSSVIGPLLDLPDPDPLRALIGPEGLAALKAEADEIVEGRLRLFGGLPMPLDLTPPGVLSHWTQTGQRDRRDIKFIWEPARFGWAFTLGRAYHLTGDERYPAAFWCYFEIFQQANPVNMGPNWESAQEVALRLIAFTFAAQIFANSPHSTVHRQASIAQSCAEHAARIPPTLIYARAQNNNHLLSEAAGLITAALALPEHPQAKRWSKLGWKWFNRGLESQIAEDGSYIQQSTNYHRLMLQLALWVFQITPDALTSDPLPSNLATATRWLLALTDPKSGSVPNLGPNDGAYVLPLTSLPFADYQPVLQAAANSFLGEPAFEPGPWDEMCLWLSTNRQPHISNENTLSAVRHPSSQLSFSTLRAPHSWAYLRAAHFTDRPGHADQLHLDLWWRGLNVAQDPGTYLYNAAPPWDNALTHTAVHNTVMVDDCEQMTRAGRFLYLDRAQAGVLLHELPGNGPLERIVAQHNGYSRLGILHMRTVTACQDDQWVITDDLQPTDKTVLRCLHTVRLHWLLPDWEFEIENDECGIWVDSPKGKISLFVRTQASINNPQSEICSLQLVRAGERLHGPGQISPTWGWVSPTYGVRVPALSFAVTVVSELPVTLISEWGFPNE